jgi:hypothetical protein
LDLPVFPAQAIRRLKLCSVEVQISIDPLPRPGAGPGENRGLDSGKIAGTNGRDAGRLLDRCRLLDRWLNHGGRVCCEGLGQLESRIRGLLDGGFLYRGGPVGLLGHGSWRWSGSSLGDGRGLRQGGFAGN